MLLYANPSGGGARQQGKQYTINQSNTIITGDLISSLLSSATLFMKCEIHFRIVITTKETQHSAM